MDKMVRTKWYWTKWYGQNGTDKTVWTKWYGQIGTAKILRIMSSINPVPIDTVIFSSIPASILIPVAFLYVLIIYL